MTLSLASFIPGAQIILLQELFERLYFCQTQDYENINYATTVDKNPAIKHFKRIARELSVVLPISFYERSGNARYDRKSEYKQQDLDY